MPLQPTNVKEIEFKGAKGINDVYALAKQEQGMATFAFNLTAGGDVWPRRNGRDFSELSAGNLVLGIYALTWDNGVTSKVVAVGTTMGSF